VRQKILRLAAEHFECELNEIPLSPGRLFELAAKPPKS
jgi:hypothetical protein